MHKVVLFPLFFPCHVQPKMHETAESVEGPHTVTMHHRVDVGFEPRKVHPVLLFRRDGKPLCRVKLLMMRGKYAEVICCLCVPNHKSELRSSC